MAYELLALMTRRSLVFRENFGKAWPPEQRYLAPPARTTQSIGSEVWQVPTFTPLSSYSLVMSRSPNDASTCTKGLSRGAPVWRGSPPWTWRLYRRSTTLMNTLLTAIDSRSRRSKESTPNQHLAPGRRSKQANSFLDTRTKTVRPPSCRNLRRFRVTAAIWHTFGWKSTYVRFAIFPGNTARLRKSRC